MKTYILKSLAFALLSVFLLSACSKKDKTDPDNNSNTGGADLIATVVFESGDEMEFKHNFTMVKPTVTHEKGAEHFAFTAFAKKGSYGINIMAVIDDGPGTYSYDKDSGDDETVAQIQFLNYGEDMPETFMPFSLQEEKMGEVELTITSLTKDHVKATFSATLYSTKTGEKVIIKSGKINSKIDRREVDID